MSNSRFQCCQQFSSTSPPRKLADAAVSVIQLLSIQKPLCKCQALEMSSYTFENFNPENIVSFESWKWSFGHLVIGVASMNRPAATSWRCRRRSLHCRSLPPNRSCKVMLSLTWSFVRTKRYNRQKAFIDDVKG